MQAKPRRRGVVADEIQRGDGVTALKNWPLSADARDRIGLYAHKSGKPESVIVDWLICTSAELRRYVCSDRGVARADDQEHQSGDTVPTLPITESLTPSEGEPRPEASGKGSGEARRRRAAG
jgi:hypothetical protein